MASRIAIVCFLFFALMRTAKSQNTAGKTLSSFIQFSIDGKLYEMNTGKSETVTEKTVLSSSGDTLQSMSVIFSNTLGDTALLAFTDKKGLKGVSQVFSKEARLAFFFKMQNKNSFLQITDNSKNEISSASYIKLNAFGKATGERVSGEFRFSNAILKDSTNRILAAGKMVNAGSFSFTITASNIAKNTTSDVLLSNGAALLFKNVKTSLTNREKNHLFDSLGIKLSKDKKQFVYKEYDDIENQPFEIETTAVDLNKDGTDEVFFISYDGMLSGNAGSSVILYIKNRQGKYQKNLSFPAGGYDIRTTYHLGFPDLSFGVPGLKIPVWRWNGKQYDFYKSIESE